MKPDFGGYATRNDLKCSDGVTIRRDAFKDQDGAKVPLVWQHDYRQPDNVLGHAVLSNRDDGVYAECYLNGSEAAQTAKTLISHDDIDSLSIHANKLKKRGKDVIHGTIREVSLVLAGANPGAFIDYVDLAHDDNEDYDDAEATIYLGGDCIEHAADVKEKEEEQKMAEDSAKKEEPTPKEENNSEETIQDVFDTLTDKQKNAVYYIIGTIKEELDPEDDSDEDKEEVQQDAFDEEGNLMHHNVFEQEDEDTMTETSLTHSQMADVFGDAQRMGSLRDSVLKHAVDYGIENVDFLFPDAKTITESPDFVKRKTEWVSGVLSGTNHTPFSRIKSLSADITLDSARAKGYVKGTMKKDEFFALQKRTTGPTTIYKKQHMDRDDLLDITDFDTVAWLKAEMRMMLEEEIARAILIGDGRGLSDPDKIKDPAGANDGLGLRSIYNDNDFYAKHITLDTAGVTNGKAMEVLYDAIVRGMDDYEGTGTPTWYTYSGIVTDLLLWRDADGHRMFANITDLANSIGVSSIVRVPVMKNQKRTVGSDTLELQGIVVNLADYNIGTDRGGETTFFSDFDIRYNQEHYLYETRLSGALIHPASALVLEKKAA